MSRAGTPPDVIMMGRHDVPQLVDNKALLSITALMERDGVKKADFYKGEIEPCYYKGEAWILPLPTSRSQPLVFYDKKAMRDAGFNDDPAAMPKTWADLETVIKKLSIREGKELKRNGFYMSFTWDGFINWLYANEGSLLSPDGRKATFADAKGQETVEWMWRFLTEINGGTDAQEGALVPGSGDPLDTAFAAGKLCMYASGEWRWYYIKTAAPNVDMAFWPRPTNKGTKLRAPGGPGWGYVIPKGVKNVDAAWELLKWLTWEEQGKGGCWFMEVQQRSSPKISSTPRSARCSMFPTGTTSSSA